MTSSAAAATSTTITLPLSPHCQLRHGRGHLCCFAFQLKGGGAAPFIRSEQAAEDTPLLPHHPFPHHHTPHSVAVITLFASGVQLANSTLFASWFSSLRLRLCYDSEVAEH